MSSFMTQLRILLYKNFIIKKQRRKLTMLEIFFPLYFVVALVIMKTTNTNEIHYTVPSVPSYPPTLLILDYVSSPVVLAYSPNTNGMVNDVAKTIASNFSLSPNEVMGFSTFNDMTSYYRKNESSIWGGLNVDTISNTTASYEIAVNYSTSSNSAFVFSGYLGLQVAFLQSWMKTLGIPIKLDFSSNQFPTPGYSYHKNLFTYLFPSYFPFIFMYSLQQLVVMVVTEKERKIREAFKIMGMKAIASYLSWFIVHTAINIISIILVIGILLGSQVIEHSNVLAVFIPFILYGCTVTLLGFIVSIFTEKPRIATAVSSLATLLMIGVYFLVHYFVYSKGHDSFGLQFLFSLLSGIAFSEFSFHLAEAEFSGTGIQLSDPVFGHTCLFLIADIFIYLFLIWYLDNVFVGNYGVAKKWYFPFMKTYWRRQPTNLDPMNVNTPLLAYSQNGGVQVTDLHKVYDDGKVKAVNGLSLNVSNGQILALLGHNGAGKSTTINILTGLFPPTSGSINIMGYDYENQMDMIRNMVGYCPQHNILLDQLTCAEHLRVFGRLKGVSEHAIEQEIIDKLEEVGLLDKKDTLSVELSGGMKRKLSVAIAFIGGSSLIFLDECTAGMDPYSRRKIWQLLQKYKSRKTIIMTTHFMEEAELLGDFIAIMSKGKLRCSGTSLQLKNQFGVGYILRIVKEDERASSTPLDDFVKSTFPESVSLPSPSGLEVIYSIPNDMTHFGRFFAELQSKQQSLNVKSYGLSMTTLEEVFLKIAAEDHDNEHR